MDALDIARWQFGVTTVYHFLFVPLTIGLSLLVAILQTAWHRTGDDRYLKLTKFYGKLFLINFAMGIVTGIVQEFQFGMNWSDYSRFVGDIFGVPLAIEALLAFFLESTFLGLWIFGWGRLPKALHLATIWLASFGSIISAWFILAANSWMQNPVGYRINPDTGRAELTDFIAVLTNKVTLITFPHTLAGCFMVAGALVLAVALWHLVRHPDGPDTPAFRTATKLGAWTTILATAAVIGTGDIQGKIMTQVQPMKMAAAEALYTTESPASFSIVTVGTLDGSREIWTLKIPYLLSWLSTGDPTGEVQGINDLQAQYAAQYGPGSYTPIIPVTYWSFRFMIGFGLATAAIALWALWTTRRGRTPTSRWLLRAGLTLPVLPLLANTFGWIFTEMGRQPWIVFGEMLTRDGVSRSVSLTEVVTSFTAFTLIYATLAVIEVKLLIRYARNGLPDLTDPPPPDDTDDTTTDRPLAATH
ncbi:cytochrome bd-I ubiquinol oxidase subunit 1 apoprotein [Micromonospora sp. Llam0]|uniref:cytochrome ubiquinol oxidase subunit I n=1 Tax=Micromonosporaceae TaxID=28056 RepID=UPI000F4AD14A|nr:MULTISPECIES: cytochrome ubiquinol oxidase subunit I [Micromonosporaceae]ROO60067.1 cytochrome bd-I ubiquinol oxidase subunit 1 apoprotein [Micromonospora sp. Llam0]WBB99595.1 cytochrome ubiquinol oxidase subunit I [Solwaraspora sp. WMMA2059]WBC21854.1 cytochrome ubiquinol oxidase subunit I [Solwaraspora sp. WMMA2080]WJK36098.1 cytochrome ubiquinol oxidase subunit I [Solwaraspora sp. WMMA2065]